jgi:hypothetical protein
MLRNLPRKQKQSVPPPENKRRQNLMTERHPLTNRRLEGLRTKKRRNVRELEN